MATPQLIEPYSPGFQLDPYPTLARLRESAPVTRMRHPELGEAWLVIRHQQVRDLLVDPTVVKPVDEDDISLDAAPPTHTRLRGLVQKAFTTRRVQELRTWATTMTGELLDGLAGRDRVDLVSEYANVMPINVISRMCGLPPEDAPKLERIMNAFLGGENEELRDQIFGETHQYVTELVESKRRSPGDDLTSDLIAARDGGDRLTEHELVRMLMTLLVNGVVTTTNVIGTGVNALLDWPDQFALLRDRPELLESAVEEMLRFESPVSAITWQAAADLDVAGFAIPAGDYLVTAVQGANRDPSRFPDPDRFDISRSPNPHLTFSHGIHRCLGAPLARLELQIALAALIRRFPGMRRAGDPVWRDSYVVRGLTELPIHPAPGA